ncbi:hypothetical protein [Streptomyces sp. NPDC058751]|uniref:hypothetical protein n=1 Tax=Streptomyces sp. NPDC058751 TaxID=3346623 RepID=UPI003689A9A2
MAFGPGHDVAPERAGSPNNGDPGVHQPQPEKDFLRRMGVVELDGVGHDQQGQAAGARHEMPYTAVDLFAWVVTAGVLPHGRCGFD